MTQKISVDTASALAGEFYRRLRDHGEADRALVQATAGLAESSDVTVPVLYNRLGGRPIFSDILDRPLTASEIEYGLGRLEAHLPERAPVMSDMFLEKAQRLRGMLGADRANLSKASQDEWKQAEEEINALSEEVLDLSFPALALGKEPPYYDVRCPFPGLLAFGARFAASGKPEEDDRQFFFGRETLVDDLVRKLKAHPFLAVLGSSGSGKSSLVLAGVVPTLEKMDRQEELRMAYMTPGADPLARLSDALGTPNSSEAPGHELPAPGDMATTVLVVDQFEELFALTQSDDGRRKFVDRLLELAGPCYVVLTMRADFWGDCAPYRALKDAMLAHQALIAPMTASELRSAMEQQAAKVGLRFEADLSNRILDEVKGEPGAMPLLEHLLLEMWKRRHGRWLRAVEYGNLGGIKEAIAHTADDLYESLSPDDKNLMRHIFVRLTRVAPLVGGEPEQPYTRQRVPLGFLAPQGYSLAPTRNLVNTLANARLVFVDRGQVEVAHEALLRHWPRLQEWLREDQAAIALRQTVQNATSQWHKSRRPDLLVHQSDQLESALALRDHTRVSLSTDELEYLEICQQVTRSEFRVTIHKGGNGEYPVLIEYMPRGAWLPTRQYGVLRLSDESYEYLQRTSITSRDYGSVLGRALFTEELYFTFVQAWVTRVAPLRVCITVEEPRLQLLHWEKLTAPMNKGRWDFLSTATVFSLNYHSVTQHTFRPLDRHRLRALILIAAPLNQESYGGARLDPESIATYIRASMDGVDCDLLGRVAGSSGPATLEAFSKALITGNYPLVHIAAHGQFSELSRRNSLILEDVAHNGVVLPAEQIIEHLKSLPSGWRRPMFLYLPGSSSDFRDRNERGRLGPRLVAEVGIPSVLAKVQSLPPATSRAVIERFYPRLLTHGEPDRALAEAKEQLRSEPYSFVPFIYSRLDGRSLFSEKIRTGIRQTEAAIDVEILVRSKAKGQGEWFVTSMVRRSGSLVSGTFEAETEISLQDLDERRADPRAYGASLGQAVLHPAVAEIVTEAVRVGTSGVGIQLVVESSELRDLHWEWLSLVTDGGKTHFVASLPGVRLAQVAFSSLSQIPPCLPCHHLRALGVVALPDLEHIPVASAAELVKTVESALSDFTLEVLSHAGSEAERPTLDAVVKKLNSSQYAVLHLLVRATRSQYGSDVLLGLGREPKMVDLVRLEREHKRVDVVRLERLLQSLDSVRHLPQLAFLMTPYSDDASATSALRLLARTVVEEAGFLAAVAVHANLSQRTSEAFASHFYRGLRTHGVVDRAHGEACAEASRFPDFVPPALFSRLKDHPLFYCQDDAPASVSPPQTT